MELPDPAASSSSPTNNDATNRRRSGRTKQQPVLYQKDPNILYSSSGGEKRKRVASHGGDVHRQDVDSEDESDPEGSDSGPDEEELKERRKNIFKARKPSDRPASKKPKTAAAITTKLPVRPATNGFKKPAKPKKTRARPSAAVPDEDGGLYSKKIGQVLVGSHC